MEKSKNFLNIYRKTIAVLLAFTLLLFASYMQTEDRSTVYTLSKIGSRGNEVRQIQKKLR